MSRTPLLRGFSTQLKLNMASGVMAMVISAVVNLLGYRIYLTALGYHDLGVWFVLTSVVSFSQVGGLGLMPALMKSVAESLERRDMQAIRNDALAALLLVSVTSASATLLLLSCRGLILRLFGLSDSTAALAYGLLPFLGFLILPTLAGQVLGGVLGGLGRLDFYHYAFTAGRVVAVTTAAFLLTLDLGLWSLLVANTLAQVLILSASVLFAIRRIGLGRPSNMRLDARRIGALLGFGGNVLAGSALSLVVSPFNKVVVARFVAIEAVTVYELTYQAAYQARGLIEAAFRALTAEVGRLQANLHVEGLAKLRSLVRHSVGLATVLGVPVFGGAMIFAEELLNLWLGDSSSPELITPLRLLLAGVMLSLFGVPSIHVLLGLGQPGRIRTMYAVQLTANVLSVVALMAAGHELSVVSVAICTATGVVASTAYVIGARRAYVAGLASKRH